MTEPGIPDEDRGERIDLRYSILDPRFPIFYPQSSACFLDALVVVCYRNDSYEQARFKCKNLMYWSLAVELRA